MTFTPSHSVFRPCFRHGVVSRQFKPDCSGHDMIVYILPIDVSSVLAIAQLYYPGPSNFQRIGTTQLFWCRRCHGLVIWVNRSRKSGLMLTRDWLNYLRMRARFFNQTELKSCDQFCFVCEFCSLKRISIIQCFCMKDCLHPGRWKEMRGNWVHCYGSKSRNVGRKMRWNWFNWNCWM